MYGKNTEKLSGKNIQIYVGDLLDEYMKSLRLRFRFVNHHIYVCLSICESHISLFFHAGNKSPGEPLKDLSRRYLILARLKTVAGLLGLLCVNLYHWNIKLIKYCFRIYYSFIVPYASFIAVCI